MRHAREDYEAIQPWPQKRPHHVKIEGVTVMEPEQPEYLGKRMEPIIPDDEPVFLIRAKDVNGPTVVRFWAAKAHESGCDDELYEKVMAWAETMQDYQEEHYGGGKTPDTPEGLLK